MPSNENDQGDRHSETQVSQFNTNQAANQNQQNVQEEQTRQNPRTSRFAAIRSVMLNMMIFWLVTKYLLPSSRNSQPASGKLDPIPAKRPSSNLYGAGFRMDMYVYVSEDSFEPDFFNPSELKWVLKDVVYDDWTQGPNRDSIFQTEFQMRLSPKVQNNGSLWIHAYFVQSGYVPYEQTREAQNYSPIYTLHKKKLLTRYKKRKYRDTHNLITGKTEKSLEEQNKIKNKIDEEIISHWHPNLTINMIYDHTAWTQGGVPAPLDEYVDFESSTGQYYPVVYLNDYWNLLRDYQPINNSVKSINLSFTYQPLSMIKWQLYAAQTMRSKWSNMLGAESIENENEQDSIKEAILETSPVLLALTVIVSLAHSIFEFLAFKNDIQFWNERKSLEGLSVRSVFFNLFQSVIVLLYVLDNDTNTLIRISIGVGLLIELWKIPKVVDIKIDRQNKYLGIVPRISMEHKGSYVESSTKEYDALAYRYLSWIIFPLFIGYGIYSLVYNEHKGWYSFTLNMSYGFLLAFGFIMMTPQLFINYKLKSVAHLPWRMLSYKFLNTFIDDIFAFVIKMPLMYRLGCFRDDIIFIIYLYQRWIYRVDPKRVNEFGISGEDMKPQNENTSKEKANVKSAIEKKND